MNTSGFAAIKVSDQFLAALEQLTQTTEHFHQAHHRQALHRKIGGQAFGLHQRTTDPNELHRWMTGFERAHQAGAQNITGSFTRHQRNT